MPQFSTPRWRTASRIAADAPPDAAARPSTVASARSRFFMVHLRCFSLSPLQDLRECRAERVERRRAHAGDREPAAAEHVDVMLLAQHLDLALAQAREREHAGAAIDRREHR